MSTADSARTATECEDLPERRVTPLELFFDLVFVFALTQVTGFLADHLSWTGMLEGAALLVVLWWAWAGYVWLTNAVPAEEVIPARLVILIAMAADRKSTRLNSSHANISYAVFCLKKQTQRTIR